MAVVYVLIHRDRIDGETEIAGVFTEEHKAYETSNQLAVDVTGEPAGLSNAHEFDVYPIEVNKVARRLI